jgi:hypothetical protein
MPCSLRIAGFIGLPCAPQSTVVGCHVGSLGKGTATKVSDLSIAAGCSTCHDLIDGRDNRIDYIRKHYPLALGEQVLRAVNETQARWVEMGLLTAQGQEVI